MGRKLTSEEVANKAAKIMEDSTFKGAVEHFGDAWSALSSWSYEYDYQFMQQEIHLDSVTAIADTIATKLEIPLYYEGPEPDDAD